MRVNMRGRSRTDQIVAVAGGLYQLKRPGDEALHSSGAAPRCHRSESQTRALEHNRLDLRCGQECLKLVAASRHAN
jgi:hypothetical protein